MSETTGTNVRFYQRSISWILVNSEKYLPALSVAFFILGTVIGQVSVTFSEMVDTGMSWLIGGYGIITPIINYLVLGSSLIKILAVKGAKGARFVQYAIVFLAKIKLVACIWAAIFTALVFGLPLISPDTVAAGMSNSILEVLKSFGRTFISSTAYWAIYAAVLTAIFRARLGRITTYLEGFADGMGRVGNYFVPFVPLLMLVVGTYVVHLPTIINNEVDGIENAALGSLSMAMFTVDTNTATGMITAYVIGALLTGLGCAIWHSGLLLFAKYRTGDFSIKYYLKNYWSRVSTMLWATSSEDMTMPLSLHLLKKYYPRLKAEVANFIVGIGQFDLNGTTICVFVTTGLVATILNYQLSFLQLLILVPLAFVLGYAVPGIPGELVLYAAPIASVLAIPPEIAPSFLILYIGLQIGLPDSFRTVTNSTDSAVATILLNERYEGGLEDGE